jgi:hypothetical protein
MFMNNKEKKYKGLGFVESLIALTVSGIVAIVLMNISASSLNDLKTLEIRDKLEFHAISTAVHLQNLAINAVLDDPDNNPFDSLIQDKCYLFDESESIKLSSPYNPEDREAFKNSPVPDDDDEYFRVFCVESDPTDKRKIYLKIIVGFSKMEGEATSKRDVKDYEYLAIINL